ncbi:hypothetical protein BDZ88DRAFT_418460 [Geranomyces variabilis]|nr:hypothetical protein BDZ88DRAFT_418460 [Geranomyces variabilis]KAJ3133325.1 hypothetical protein HDU90_006274 [Geranomyces variabilis]
MAKRGRRAAPKTVRSLDPLPSLSESIREPACTWDSWKAEVEEAIRKANLLLASAKQSEKKKISDYLDSCRSLKGEQSWEEYLRLRRLQGVAIEKFGSSQECFASSQENFADFQRKVGDALFGFGSSKKRKSTAGQSTPPETTKRRNGVHQELSAPNPGVTTPSGNAAAVSPGRNIEEENVPGHPNARASDPQPEIPVAVEDETALPPSALDEGSSANSVSAVDKRSSANSVPVTKSGVWTMINRPTPKPLDAIVKHFGATWNEVLDLRPSSSVFFALPHQLQDNYAQYMTERVDSLVSDATHEFLVDLFCEERSLQVWQTTIDALGPSKDPQLNSVIRVIRATLPTFLKAFCLGALNPLLRIETLECSHLNAYVHPVLERMLWEVANVHYDFGEIPDPFLRKQKADGLGILTDADKLPIVYVEGSRPCAKKSKDHDDGRKLAVNTVAIQEETIKTLIQNRRRIPKMLATYGGQSFGTTLRLNMTEHFGAILLHEIDCASVPRDPSELPLFVEFYEAVLKWSEMVAVTVQSFKEAKRQKRTARISTILGLRALIDDK